MIIEESGKFYNIDEETGLVTEAGKSSDVDSLDGEYRIGDRVEVAGATGSVVSIIPSIYGAAFGIRFDDGELDEFGESQLKRSSVEKTTGYANKVEEILARYSEYEELPNFTNDEISTKEETARHLHLTAKNVAANSKLSLRDQNQLGKIILVTETDIKTLQELRDNSEESQNYLASFNQYKLADEISGYGAGLGLTGDASWLEDAMDEMEVVETTDTDLAARATEVVAALTKEQLEDEEFFRLTSSYHYDYLQMDEDQKKKFDKYLARAKADRLKELPAESKTASTDEDIDDFDTSALYL